MKVSLILACAGKGERAGFSTNKLLVKTNGQTVIERTLSQFVKTGLIDQYVVTASREDFNLIRSLLPKEVNVVIGGKTRTESIRNGLNAVDGQIVLIHDGARPFVSEKIILNCIETAKKEGSAIPVIALRDTVCKAKENLCEYLGKKDLYSVQTPQGFKTELIKNAYSLAKDDVYNDDGEVYKLAYGSLAVFDGDNDNVKLTFNQDFSLLNSSKGVRVGTGFDCHRLVENRKLILGGISIPHDKGLLGHSDADVLTHAVMDAMLSACSLRDIGYYFPDSDQKYKDANSVKLLEEVIRLCKDAGYQLNNLSVVIMAEKPKLMNFIPQICLNLASVLSVSKDQIGISATTLEGLGIIGREEGICVSASVTMSKIN